MRAVKYLLTAMVILLLVPQTKAADENTAAKNTTPRQSPTSTNRPVRNPQQLVLTVGQDKGDLRS